MIIDIPYIHLYIRKEFLDGESVGQYVEAYVFSATAIINRPLLFTVHTEDGAVFSRLPIHALTTKPCSTEYTLEDLMPWGCVGNKVQAIQHAYLKDYKVKVIIQDKFVNGTYKFTIDQFDGGFSEDPEQHKTMNIIELDSGELCAMPNNKCLFKDTFFAEGQDTVPRYKRQTKYWSVG